MSIPRYIGAWNPSDRQDERSTLIKKGDYVVATKYADGDPGDNFCIGFYDGYFDHFGTKRHLVIDSCGNQFRRSGFRRVAKVSSRRGEWMVRNLSHIEAMMSRFSVWHWYRAPWRELNEVENVRKAVGN